MKIIWRFPSGVKALGTRLELGNMFHVYLCRVIRDMLSWLHLARSGSQSHRAIWFIFPARGASHILRLDTGQVLFEPTARLMPE